MQHVRGHGTVTCYYDMIANKDIVKVVSSVLPSVVVVTEVWEEISSHRR